MRFSRRHLGLLFLVPAVGCGGQSAGKTVPVSGKVTLDGRPLANATVIFTPPIRSRASRPHRPAAGPTIRAISR